MFKKRLIKQRNKSTLISLAWKSIWLHKKVFVCFISRRNAAACTTSCDMSQQTGCLGVVYLSCNYRKCEVVIERKLFDMNNAWELSVTDMITIQPPPPPPRFSRLCNRNMTTEACNVENRLRTTFWIAINCTRASVESQKLTMMIVVKQSLWKALADTSIFHHYGDIDFWLEWDTSRGIEKRFTATLIAVYENVFMALQFSPHFSSSRAGRAGWRQAEVIKDSLCVSCDKTKIA